MTVITCDIDETCLTGLDFRRRSRSYFQFYYSWLILSKQVRNLLEIETRKKNNMKMGYGTKKLFSFQEVFHYMQNYKNVTTLRCQLRG